MWLNGPFNPCVTVSKNMLLSGSVIIFHSFFKYGLDIKYAFFWLYHILYNSQCWFLTGIECKTFCRRVKHVFYVYFVRISTCIQNFIRIHLIPALVFSIADKFIKWIFKDSAFVNDWVCIDLISLGLFFHYQSIF